MTPNFELGRDICAMHLPQVSSSCVYSSGSYRVDKQTNTPTNKQTPLETSNALRYATTLGNYTMQRRVIRRENSGTRQLGTSRHSGVRTTVLSDLLYSLYEHFLGFFDHVHVHFDVVLLSRESALKCDLQRFILVSLNVQSADRLTTSHTNSAKLQPTNTRNSSSGIVHRCRTVFFNLFIGTEPFGAFRLLTEPI